MALDSEAAFESRLKELQLGPYADAFKAAGWGSAGSFAFSCNYVPGGVDESSFVIGVVTLLLGAPDHALKAALKRLHFECYTLMVSEMRRKVERVDDDAPRRLPPPEREARRARQATELRGLVLTGEYECSHGLVDKAVQMIEDNCIAYIPVDECNKRESEMGHEKKDKTLKTDGRGFVRESTNDQRIAADINSDLKLKNAFVRRGLAFDQAQVMSFAVHEMLVSLLFTEYLREAPVGFSKVSQDQLMRADREVFRRLQEKTRTGIRPGLDGTKPIDTHMQAVLDSAGVQMLLLPWRSGGVKRERDEAAPAAVVPGSTKAAKKKAKKNANAAELAQLRETHGRAPPAAAAKAAARAPAAGARRTAMPRALVGMCAACADGRSICFSFNLPGGCPTETARGARCAKGFHVCCKPACEQAHPLAEHPA
jgi:hypothetical protein